jgi:hypothetical protein
VFIPVWVVAEIKTGNYFRHCLLEGETELQNCIDEPRTNKPYITALQIYLQPESGKIKTLRKDNNPKLQPQKVNNLSALGGAVASRLRHYATNRQVAGSIPDGVIGIFT